MAFVALFEPPVSFVLWLGLTVFCLVVAMMVLVVALRLLSIIRERRRKNVAAVWGPIMMESIERVPEHLPDIARADRIAFLMDWNHLQESVRGECKTSLNELARRTGMHEVVMELLNGGSSRDRLIAVAATGHLQLREAWHVLKEYIEHEDPVLSVAAARALVQINPTRAVSLVMRYVSRREDWPPTKVANMLREAPSDIISTSVPIAVLFARKEFAPRLVRFLELVDPELAAETIRQILETDPEPATIAACLHILRLPDQRDLVQKFLLHDDPQVRLRAAEAFSRIGTEADAQELVTRLGDSEWEVCYSSAQSLAKIPSVDRGVLQELRNGQSDPRLDGILTHVIAESTVR